ncbi:P-loop containing nucleoside triphosphate hydrolase protein [Mycena epipterygia]|nr:P-loop containing nucleoside triphosphate hydrolase protein [Mycena epipterygia]
MPSQHPLTLYRLDNIILCLNPAIAALDDLSRSFDPPFLEAISNTTTSLINAVKPRVLHKIHVFVEGQKDGNKFKQFFRQNEMKQILKDVQTGLQQALDVFKVENNMSLNITDMQRKAEKQHQELIEYIAGLSDGTTSDGSSSIQTGFTKSSDSSISLSLLPSQPQIFHGRDGELRDIIDVLRHESPRIVILGAGGIGKTSLARAALHHPDVVVKYESRFFIGAEVVNNSIDLASLIGADLGLKPGNDPTKLVISHLSKGPACLLVLDNLETAWEPLAARGEIEELLSLLADIAQVALVITMRGTERPAKVLWTRPFLPPLKALTHDAAHQTFIDIADDFHKNEDIEKLLLLTDNMPLAVNLIAHLVDYEGCLNTLARWEVEKTSMLSDGQDKRSSLDASIELSLSSPRVSTGAKDLLSLLAILPDGLSDVELVQSKLPIQDILTRKSTLLSTSLASVNEKGQLKVLVPIREFMLAHYPPPASLIQPLRKYFYGLLNFQHKYSGNLSDARTAACLTSNLMNIQNMLIPELHQDNPVLEEAIQAAIHLNRFRIIMGQSRIPLLDNIQSLLNHMNNHQLVVMFIKELFTSWQCPIGHPTALIAQAQKCFIHITDPYLELTRILATLGSWPQALGLPSGDAAPGGKLALHHQIHQHNCNTNSMFAL